MSDTQQFDLEQAGAFAAVPAPEEDAIILSTRIEVEGRRVFLALSIPEYMEAWLQPPEPEELLVFGFVNQERFQVDLYRAEAHWRSIHGSARIVNRNRVVYIWKTISPCATSHTEVDLKLTGTEDGCLLALKHSGFQNMVERAWHRRMWMQSLEKLSRITRAPAPQFTVK